MIEGLVIDCFAGGGGASCGIEQALGRDVDIAVNHDEEAIRMHKVNHPKTLHLTEDIFEVDLQKYVAGRHVALLWGSPDCRSFSKAKGSAPRSKSVRMLPWAVHKHVQAVRPDVVLMENVEEIQQWGPLDEEGHVIKELQGIEFEKFIQAMKDLGYSYEGRELVAADYGAPTIRKRWYGVFRCDGKPIRWPEPTHFKDKEPYWKPCCDYIDWSNLGKSIFKRNKDLAETTQKRIALGIKKFIVDNPNPYIVNEPKAIAFLIQYHNETREGEVRGQLLTKPLMTIETKNRYGLVTAFLEKYDLGGNLVAGDGYLGKISAFLIKYYGTGGGQSVTSPLSTIVTKDRFGLVNVVLDIEGEKYIIKDIFLRMLKPSELKLMQGFPESYVIDHDIDGQKINVCEQVAKIGNSVCPPVAKAIVEANCA